MSGESDPTDGDQHCCQNHATWRPDDTAPGEPVPGVCTECGADLEHYCDNHWPRDGDLELVDHHRHTDAPIYAIQYDCPACGRELEMRLQKRGTFDQQTGDQVYGP